MTTLMAQEARQTPDAVARAFSENQALFVDICAQIKKRPIRFAATIARGSSDHAASFAKYLFETQLGLVTASLAPSINTIYHASLQLKDALVIAISQSGASPDICDCMQAARDAGAITVAFVNHTDSRLASIADYVVPLHAGEENAVAATKSYLTSLSNLIHFAAVYAQDNDLLQAMKILPATLSEALNCDWQTFIDMLQPHSDTLMIGRGYGYPISQEAALKCKETAGIHAESFSSAEVQHGPMAIVGQDYPVMMFTQDDNSLGGTLQLSEKLLNMGAKPLVAISHNQTLAKGIHHLPLPKFIHPICDPLIGIQAFYPAMAGLAVARGYNPDQPEHLNKVTKTL